MIQSLISAARKFYDSLLQINEKLSLLSSAIQQQTAAIDKANDATEKHYDTPPMVRTELHIPEADKEEQKRGRIEKKWIGRVQTVLEGLTLAAIVYYACSALPKPPRVQTRLLVMHSLGAIGLGLELVSQCRYRES